MLLLTFAAAAIWPYAASSSVHVTDEASTSAGACVSDEDCYGGKCLPAGKCLCPPLWTGPACQTLRVKPARVSTPGLLLPKTSTWGGGAVQDKAGLWHMFAAQIKAHCGLHSWGRNSEIVHATGPAPDGPYQLVGTVLPTLSHGPAPTLLSDGRVVLGELGCGNETQPNVQGCSNGTTPKVQNRQFEFGSLCECWCEQTKRKHTRMRLSRALAIPVAATAAPGPTYQ